MKNLYKLSLLALLGLGFTACADDSDVSSVSDNTAQACVSGAVKCSENGMMTFICKNGEWTPNASCVYGCMNGACVANQNNNNNNENNSVNSGNCTNGSRVCSDDQSKVYLCLNGVWVFGDMCSNGCTLGTCNPAGVNSSTNAACVDGSVKCADNGLGTYICIGGQWTVKDICGNGCANGQCVNPNNNNNSGSQVGCSLGSRKCSEDGLSSLVCQNGQWEVSSACPYGCLRGICVDSSASSGIGSSCTTGSRKCSDDGRQTIVCVGGEWNIGEKCNNGCQYGVCLADESGNGSGNGGNGGNGGNSGNTGDPNAVEGSDCDASFVETCNGSKVVYCEEGKVINGSYDCAEYEATCESFTLDGGVRYADCVTSAVSCSKVGETVPMCDYYYGLIPYEASQTCTKADSGNMYYLLSGEVNFCESDCNADKTACDANGGSGGNGGIGGGSDYTICTQDNCMYSETQSCLDACLEIKGIEGCYMDEEYFYCGTPDDSGNGGNGGNSGNGGTSSSSLFYCGDMDYSDGVKLSDVCGAQIAICETTAEGSYYDCYDECSASQAGSSKGLCVDYSAYGYGFILMNQVCQNVEGHNVFVTDYDNLSSCSNGCNAAGTGCL